VRILNYPPSASILTEVNKKWGGRALRKELKDSFNKGVHEKVFFGN